MKQAGIFTVFQRFLRRLILTFILTLAFIKTSISIQPLISLSEIRIGAGEGNRTLVSALGRPHSPIDPPPPALFEDRRPATLQMFIRLPRRWQLVCRFRPELQADRWRCATPVQSLPAGPAVDRKST